MRILLRRATRSDPTTFVLSFGAFAAICGVCLLMPGNTFDYSPSWSSLQAIHADDRAWGWMMLIDGALLIASIRMHAVPQRAAIAGFSAIMWMLLGGSMVFSAYRQGITSIVGLYALFGALGCLIALEQSLHYPAAGDVDGNR